jgi:hypothetical protein
MITNAMPDKVLTSGRWFDPAPVPRPFAMAQNMRPFSNKMRARLRDNSTDGLIVVKNGVIVRQYYRTECQMIFLSMNKPGRNKSMVH